MTTTESQSPLDIARKLAPMIRSCADQIEADRELPRPLFEALADAGLFQLALPRSLGGAEIDLPTYVQVLEEIGKADASTGWIVNQCAIFATYAARMPSDIARLIWIDTPRSIVANTPLPTAQAIVVPGGYRVTGRQGFSTGCRHAAWLAARAQVLENGQPRLQDGQPEQLYLFVPAAEAELLDTGPLYQIPRTLLFGSGDAAVALGMARSCLAAFFELAGAKTPRAMQATLRDQPMVQAAVGRAEADLRSGRAFLSEAVRELWTETMATGETTQVKRATLRLAATHGIRLAVNVIDTVYNLAGVTTIYEGNLIQRYFQDVHVISQHLQARLSHYEVVGQHWLGQHVDLTRP